LEKNVAYLSDRLHNLEQSSCNKDLILCGIPKVESEGMLTVDLVADFLTTTQNAVSNSDIKSAKRIVPRQDNSSS
jgi:hypothetical protein